MREAGRQIISARPADLYAAVGRQAPRGRYPEPRAALHAPRRAHVRSVRQGPRRPTAGNPALSRGLVVLGGTGRIVIPPAAQIRALTSNRTPNGRSQPPRAFSAH